MRVSAIAPRRRPDSVSRACLFVIAASLFLSGCYVEGVRSEDPGAQYPANAQVAAGPNQVVQVAGGILRVFARSPFGEVATSSSLSSILGCSETLNPRIRYDSSAQRWIVVAAQKSPVPRLCLAVSTSSDPTGTFQAYQLSLATGLFPNYPTLGISADKVAIAANQIQLVPGQGSPPGYGLWILNKSALMSGTLTSQFIFLGTAPPLFAPAVNLSSNSTIFMAGFGPSLLRTWRVTGLPPSVTLISQDFSLTYDPVTPNVAQKGSIDSLLAVGGVRNVVYRGGFLWVAASSACTPAGDTIKRTCLRLVNLIDNGSTFTLSQNIEYGSAGFYYFYPAVTVDADQALVVSFGVSSSSMYPSWWATGRRTGDAANTLRTPTVIAVGQAPYTNGDAVADVLDWGRYFDASADPANDHWSWLTGQYASVFSPPTPGTPPLPPNYATGLQWVADQLY